MRFSKALAAAVAISVLAVTACSEGSIADNEVAAVWALEQQIYARRAQGDTLFYSDISSEDYLGWPAPAAPFSVSRRVIGLSDMMNYSISAEHLREL